DERLSLVPGLRWEIFRDDFPGTPGTPAALGASGTSVQSFLSPHGGIRFTPRPFLTLLANAGRWAREPNLSELFGTQGVIVGNPKPRPETSITVAAVSGTALPAMPPLTQAGLEYAWFDDEADDLIVLVQNSQNIIRPENVTSASVRGDEVSVHGRLWERVGVSANYTHQDARDTGDVTFLRGKQLPGRP